MIGIVPAMDLLNGEVVRLRQGDYGQVTKYKASPLEIAQSFERLGYSRLHVVDLSGAKAGEFTALSVVKELSKATSLMIDCSGGIRSKEAASECLNAGAQYVCLGSLALTDLEATAEIIEEFPNRVIIAADTRGGQVRTHGWTMNSELPVVDLLSRYEQLPITGVLVTDIDQDGTLQGANCELYRQLREKFPTLRLIASGGVRTIEEAQLLLNEGTYEVIVGKALYAS